MRCVICGSLVEKLDPTNRVRCDTSGCGAVLCAENYGAECWAAHNKAQHPEKGTMNSGAVRTLIHDLRMKLKDAESRAVAAEGGVSHWRAVLNEHVVNDEARWAAAVKHMKIVCPEILRDMIKVNLIKE